MLRNRVWVNLGANGIYITHCSFQIESDKVILTSDNPRYEEPDVIIANMQEGVEPIEYKKTLSITNRKEAIKTACALAEENDIILVAGKGHETYQEIKGVRSHFDDYEKISQLLKAIEK